MADIKKRLDTNIAGNFFVDSTCINCDTCRQLAPNVFGEANGYSFVRAQPLDEPANVYATQALVCCPTGSIGTIEKNQAKEVMLEFPLNISENVSYCGFNSPKSYGGNSYFIQCSDGNWLVDAPKYLPQLVTRLEELGGIKYIFLTHRDDVADAEQYASRFGAQRIIHRADLSAARSAEIVVDGVSDIEFAPDFKIIPTPGHTAGHCALLYRDKYLFTGDHLAWDRESNHLEAWPDVCWFDWNEQKKSLARLRNLNFEWVIPGHGQRVFLPAAQMQKELEHLLATLP